MNELPKFTTRQGETLAFIHGYTAKYGIAPCFEEIATHFGISSPSVNGMIKTLEQKGLLSRVKGAARSLRVLVPSNQLPQGSFGGSKARRLQGWKEPAAGPSPGDLAFAAAVAVLDTMRKKLGTGKEATGLVEDAARAVYRSLLKAGLKEEEALEVARRLAAEVARYMPEGKGITVSPYRWVRR